LLIGLQFKQIIGVAYLESRWIKRQPLWIFQSIISSIGFILILFAWGSISALRNLVVAYIVAGAWSQGLNIVAQSIGWSRIGGEYERYIASPVTLSSYFLGIVLATSPFMLITLIPATILAIILTIKITEFLLLLSLIPIALIIGAFLSLSIILRIKNPTNISAITNPLNTFTIVLPPVYYPLTVVPENLRIICLFMPTVSLVELGRWIILHRSATNIMYAIIIIAGWLVALTILLLRKLRWGLE